MSFYFHDWKKKKCFALNVAVAISVGSGSHRLHTLNATGLGIFSRVYQKVFWEIYKIIF